MVLIEEINDEVMEAIPELPTSPDSGLNGEEKIEEKNKIEENSGRDSKQSQRSETAESAENAESAGSGGEVEAEKAKREMYSPEEEKQIIEYIHQFTHSKEYPDIVEKFIGPHPTSAKFWKGYIEATGSTRQPISLMCKFQRLIKNLYLLPVTTEIKMDIYYSLNLPIPLDFVETVTKEVNIKMDSMRNIEAFEMKSAKQLEQELKMRMKKTPKKPRRSTMGVRPAPNPDGPKSPKKRRSSLSLKPAAEAAGTLSSKRAKSSYDEAEDVRIWKFFLDKITDPETKAVVKDEHFKPKSVFVWREFLGEKADGADVRRYIGHFESMKKNLHKMPFDDKRKLDLYYALHIPINAEYLVLLRQMGTVVTDENGFLLECNSTEFVDKSARTRMY